MKYKIVNQYGKYINDDTFYSVLNDAFTRDETNIEYDGFSVNIIEVSKDDDIVVFKVEINKRK